MYRGETIEISSSPEPQSPRKAASSLQPRKTQHPRPHVSRENEVIVVTDSEDLPSGVQITPARARNAGKAGPSRLATPSSSQLKPVRRGLLSNTSSQAGPSGSGSKTPARATPAKILKKVEPLFLASDDETDPLRANPEPPQEVLDPFPFPDDGPLIDQDPDWPIALEAASPPPEANPIDSYVARVLEIIPDVQLEHLFALIEKHIPTCQEQTVERVLHLLFEDPTYPKVDKGKRKRVEAEPDGGDRGKPKPKVDYGSKDREYKGGPSYVEIAMEQLLLDFPFIPKPHVRLTFFARNSLYAPTYLFLAEEKAMGNLPYVPKTKPSYAKAKGKGKVQHDDEFENERQWLVLKLQEDAAVGEVEDEDEDCDDGIECGCCFSTYRFEKMIQCPETHLFCKTCMAAYASNLLGAQDPNIVCMDQSGCKLAFPMSELSRFLTPKLIDLYNRVKQRKEIDAAGLENLEECPFCEYKVVIENEQEKLFRCENNDCGAVSCRECKKADHLPKSCKEMEEDKHLGGRHAIEEAMTRALTRNCPKCKTAFVKEHGCNKMTCPNCHTLSCYVCREIISGYEHFETVPGRAAGKCALSDVVALELQHNEDVAAAAKRALEDYKREHPDVEDKDITVELPRAQAPPQYPNFLGVGGYPQALPPPVPPHVAQPYIANPIFGGLPPPAPVRRPRARRAPRVPKAPKRR